ncbi:MAG TPA: hypothetical protein DDW52_01560, partial [Planctomycetaceae bacterium]|nr:hypothetical protein [Planctomycetaceae bacterium]
MEHRISPINGKPISASAGPAHSPIVPFGALPLASSSGSGLNGQAVNRQLFDQHLQPRPAEQTATTRPTASRDDAGEDAGARDDAPQESGKAERSDQSQDEPLRESAVSDSSDVELALTTVDLALQTETQADQEATALDEVVVELNVDNTELTADADAASSDAVSQDDVLAINQVEPGSGSQTELSVNENNENTENLAQRPLAKTQDAGPTELTPTETPAHPNANGEHGSKELVHGSTEAESSISAPASSGNGQPKNFEHQSQERSLNEEQSPGELRPDFVDTATEQTDEGTKWFQQDPYQNQGYAPIHRGGQLGPYPIEPGHAVEPIEASNNVAGSSENGRDNNIITPGSNNSLVAAPSPNIAVPPATIAAGTTTVGAERVAALESVSQGNTQAGNASLANSGGSNRIAQTNAGVSAANGPNTTTASPQGQSFPDSVKAESGDITQQERVRLIQRVSRSFSRLTPQGGEMNLRLHPPQLGSLAVRVRLDGNTMSAELTAQSEAAREIISENLPILRRRLADQGIEISRFQVDVGNDT